MECGLVVKPQLDINDSPPSTLSSFLGVAEFTMGD